MPSVNAERGNAGVVSANTPISASHTAAVVWAMPSRRPTPRNVPSVSQAERSWSADGLGLERPRSYRCVVLAGSIPARSYAAVTVPALTSNSAATEVLDPRSTALLSHSPSTSWGRRSFSAPGSARRSIPCRSIAA